MKRVSPTQTAMSLFMALFVATMLTLTGCSASALSGPDLETSDETTLQEPSPPYSPGAVHNEEDGAGKDKKGVTTKSANAGHNSG